MNRYQTYANLDSRPLFEGDNGFVGLDMKLDRGLLSEGILALSENKRLRRGSADTRGGTDIPESVNFPGPLGGGFAGSIVYSNPNRQENIVVAPKEQAICWMFRADGAPALHLLHADERAIEAPAEVEFCQAFDKLILLQGTAHDAATGTYGNLIWDGLSAGGFQPIEKLDPADDTTALVPPSVYAAYFADRVLYLETWQSDEVIMSDINDPSSYDKVYGKIRVNAGHTDAIVAIAPYTKETVIIFQERSVHALNNLTIDLTLTSQEQLNPEIGLVGPYAWAHVGSDIMFLCRPYGVYRLSDVMLTAGVRVPPRPVSDRIQTIIDRINWSSPLIRKCNAAVLGEYLFFMVPLDDQVLPQTMLVYNVATDAWESVDTWTDPDFLVNRLLITNYKGARRMFGGNSENGRFYLFGEGAVDRTATNTSNHILDTIETRGYGRAIGEGPSSFKAFRRATVGMKTLNPSVTITSIVDGAYEEKVLTSSPITKNRRKFYPWGHPDYGSGDLIPVPPGTAPAPPPPAPILYEVEGETEQKREDYSRDTLGFAGIDFKTLHHGVYTALPGVKVLDEPTLITETLERPSIRQTGRWCSLRIANTTGICNVIGAGVDGLSAKNNVRVAA